MPSQKGFGLESTESNGFEYDCEQRSGVLTIEEMNEMAAPDVRARFESRQKELAAKEAPSGAGPQPAN
jgi:membrane-bound inhibitor of C-type lysozyme